MTTNRPRETRHGHADGALVIACNRRSPCHAPPPRQGAKEPRSQGAKEWDDAGCGYLANPNAAAPILQIVFLPLSFASGLFLPISMLPAFVQHLAPSLPTNRFGQVVWDAVGARTHDSLGSNILWLGGYGLVFVVIAVRAYQREEKHSFG